MICRTSPLDSWRSLGLNAAVGCGLLLMSLPLPAAEAVSLTPAEVIDVRDVLGEPPGQWTIRAITADTSGIHLLIGAVASRDARLVSLGPPSPGRQPVRDIRLDDGTDREWLEVDRQGTFYMGVSGRGYDGRRQYSVVALDRTGEKQTIATYSADQLPVQAALSDSGELLMLPGTGQLRGTRFEQELDISAMLSQSPWAYLLKFLDPDRAVLIHRNHATAVVLSLSSHRVIGTWQVDTPEFRRVLTRVSDRSRMPLMIGNAAVQDDVLFLNVASGLRLAEGGHVIKVDAFGKTMAHYLCELPTRDEYIQSGNRYGHMIPTLIAVSGDHLFITSRQGHIASYDLAAATY